MNEIAIYYDNIIICWSSIVIALGCIVGFLISNAFYYARNKYGYAAWIYMPAATVFSIFLARLIHWYCHMEQYDGLKSAITNYSQGDYCISGVIIATWTIAMLMSLVKLIPSRFHILDAFAPGFSFSIGIIRLSAIYNTSCRGKILLDKPLFSNLHLDSGIIEADGTIHYRLATFFISFLLMMIITIVLIVFSIANHRTKYKSPQRKNGHVYGLFLLLFSAEEVFIDSTRYDASHLFFSGEKLANLNKGASFMGLSQFLSALILIYLLVFYLVKSIKAGNNKIKHIILTSIAIIGFVVAGSAEYFVQRYGSMYLGFYSMQIAGIFMLIVAIYTLYKACVLPKNE